jgi:hypothetical protein
MRVFGTGAEPTWPNPWLYASFVEKMNNQRVQTQGCKLSFEEAEAILLEPNHIQPHVPESQQVSVPVSVSVPATQSAQNPHPGLAAQSAQNPHPGLAAQSAQNPHPGLAAQSAQSGLDLLLYAISLQSNIPDHQ